MKRKIRYFVLLLLLTFLVIWFIPFTNGSSNAEGEFKYCRYRLAVYEFYYYDSDVSPHSDTYIGKIIFTKKIGGSLEYFGIKKVNQKN